jgi:hemerythrin
MTEGDGASFRKQVQQLLEILRKHAAQEERAMEIHGYPELERVY